RATAVQVAGASREADMRKAARESRIVESGVSVWLIALACGVGVSAVHADTPPSTTPAQPRPFGGVRAELPPPLKAPFGGVWAKLPQPIPLGYGGPGRFPPGFGQHHGGESPPTDVIVITPTVQPVCINEGWSGWQPVVSESGAVEPDPFLVDGLFPRPAVSDQTA